MKCRRLTVFTHYIYTREKRCLSDAISVYLNTGHRMSYFEIFSYNMKLNTMAERFTNILLFLERPSLSRRKVS